MNFNPLRKFNFIFDIPDLPNFHLVVQDLNWDITNKTLDLHIRLFEDSGFDSNWIDLAKNSPNLDANLQIILSNGNTINKFLFKRLKVIKQGIDFDYTSDTEALIFNLKFKYTSYKEI